MGKLGFKSGKKKAQGQKEGDSSLVVSSTGTSPSIPDRAEEDVTDGGAPASSSDKVSNNPRADRKHSWVWEHFKEYKDVKVTKVKGQADIVEEFRRAKCIYCPKGPLGDYACDPYKNGTQGMIRLINKSCKYYPGRRAIDKNQKVLAGDKSKGNSMKMVAFNPLEVMKACVEMVVVDELPFSFVEKQGFRHFCHVAMPMFKVPCRKTLVKNFLTLYDKTKKKLKTDLAHYRVCLTTDTWTSVQNFNYMVLTAHFIHDKWEMHKRIINFCTICNHSGNSIGLLIESCLLQWGISKVLTITVDNAAANKCAIEFVRSKLNKREKPESILEDPLQRIGCYGCSHEVEFNILKEAALKFKAAFARMEEQPDSGFSAYFKEPDEEYDEDGNLVPSKSKRPRVGPPSEDEWDKAEVFVQFLRVFYEVTLRVSASNGPTIHTTFHDVLSIESEISKLFIEPEIATGLDTQKVLSDMAENMRSKFIKYYGGFRDLNPLVFMGLILDPRFKLRHVTHLLTNEGFELEDVRTKTTELRDVLMSLYEEYAPKEAPAKKRGQIEVESSSSQSTTNTCWTLLNSQVRRKGSSSRFCYGGRSMEPSTLYFKQ
ncbi:zinc finger BED domain-containing protein DAYSLEEPER-like [Rosa chinensis]|uniref:zinc finger BED domain-containing protein DAYSLEEPER-like n=1 Tax=Rosa chinensis TaxID=74649 RepID=UPI001AD8AE46|nr:zinc finger BED domain-containing protein DAYSLEEPER-like [Rosa chinensis]